MSFNAALTRLSVHASLPLAKRRSKPHVVLLDSDFRIAYAEPSAITLLSRLLAVPRELLNRLPMPVERSVREAIKTRQLSSSHNDCVIMPVPSLAIRVTQVDGENGSFVTLLVEEQLCRRYLSKAIDEFSLTRRETDVLMLILRGRNGVEIAHELCIAETTAADYTKSLLRKTNSKNRSEMLVKIFAWDDGEEVVR
jgi:DNA-binding CsgD family transcriptional regulator